MDNGYRHHHRHSIFGPLVLIAIGVLFLLRNRLPGFDAYRLIAHYWPALLIVWGIVRLVEHYTEPGVGGLSGGEVALLVVVIIFGLALTASLSLPHWHWNGDWQGGAPWEQEYNFPAHAQAALPAGMPVVVRASRASVELVATPGQAIRASVEDSVRAGSQSAAQSRFDAAAPEMAASGGVWLVRPAGDHPSDRLRSRLRLFLPAGTPVTITLDHGDIQVLHWAAPLSLTTQDGTVTVDAAAAAVTIHGGGGPIVVEDVEKSVDIQGGGDLTVHHARGRVEMSGNSYGDVSLADLPAGFELLTGDTRITCAALHGNLDLTGEGLTAADARDLQIRTHGRDIAIRAFQGSLSVRDQNGAVAALPAAGAKLGSVSIRDGNGDIALGWPQSAGFRLDALARNGDIFGDWGVTVQRDNGQAAAQGAAGGGGALIYLRTQDGNISRSSALTQSRAAPAPGPSWQ